MSGTSKQVEIELKLATDARGLKQLREAPAIVERTRDDGVTERLRSVYYDTPDLALFRHRLSLRVRRVGRRYIQCLKSADSRGDMVLRRDEHEARVPSWQPDKTILEALIARHRVKGFDSRDLVTVFQSRIRRQKRLLSMGGAGSAPSEIEVSFDEGVVENGTAQAPIAEIELELRQGSPAALYELALELHDITPVRLETLSKQDHGYLLATSARPAWQRAAKLSLAPEATVEAALESIVRNCIAHWKNNEAAALDGRDPEGVHQVRVALRRLRSAFTVFRVALPKRQRARLVAGAKEIAQALGAARDWDVFLGGLLPPVEEALPGNKALAALRNVAEATHAEAYEEARAMLRGAEATRYALSLGIWLERKEWREQGSAKAIRVLDRPAIDFAAEVLAKRRRNVVRNGSDVAELSDADVHELRIAGKKLRYATEFFGSFYRRRRVKRYLELLADFQDELGHRNDVANAARLISGLSGARGRAAKASLVREGGALLIGWYSSAAADKACLAARWAALAENRPFWEGKGGAR